jgi:hypothetical protein
MAKHSNALGAWAFLIGVVLAVIIGVIAFILGTVVPTWAIWVLFILGIIVGLLNISDKEVGPFLTAGAILVLVSFLGAGMFAAVAIVYMVLHALLLLFVPATIIVALKSVFSMAKK